MKKKNEPSFLRSLFTGVTTLVGGVGPAVHRLKEEFEEGLDRYAQAIEERLTRLVFRSLILSTTVFSMAFGLLFILMDFGGVNRGIACLCCGFAGLATLIILDQRTHKSK